jgi:GxxExxY protein
MREEEKKTNFYDFLDRDVKRLDDETEKLGAVVVDVLIEVHRQLGPGHPEAVYQKSVCFEFEDRGIPVVPQAPVEVFYKGRVVGTGFIDVLVAERIVLELKSVEFISPTHKQQVLSYLAATKLHLGYLANFNVAMMKDGIKRIIRSN